jgi:hypothetical protein
VKKLLNSTETADIVTVLSSELVASVMERYFNDVMFNVATMGTVKVTDLQASGDGFMFSLAFQPLPTAETAYSTKAHSNGTPLQTAQALISVPSVPSVPSTKAKQHA